MAFVTKSTMRILVINLTRFGDLLQTQPVLHGLCEQGHETALLCLDSFRGAATLLEHVGQVLTLPGARLLAGLDQGWPLALHDLQTCLNQIRTFEADHIINLTPTLAARLLAQALGKASGFTLDQHGFGSYSTPWAAFLQAASAHRGCSPFNLVDLFQRVSGLTPGPFVLARPAPAALARAGALLGTEGKTRFFAVQLGASQDYRRWPVSAFVQASRVVWRKTGHQPVLVGTDGEGHLARNFVEHADFPCLDLTGQTDLPTLAALLSRMALLLTNDTGTMHLAAGLGVPVAAIFLGTAQPFDTGPYLEGSVSLEPDLDCHPCAFGTQCPHNLACQATINASAVGELLTSFLQHRTWTAPADLRGRVWQAKRDKFRFMELLSLSGHNDHPRTQWIGLQREVYRQFLDQEGLVPDAALAGTVAPWHEKSCADLRQASLLLTLITEQGRLLCQRHSVALQNKFLLNCENLQDIFSQNPSLGVLGPLWHYQSKAQSRNMDDFLELCARYQHLVDSMLNRISLA